jgi:lysophospholipase L1-like esterase
LASTYPEKNIRVINSGISGNTSRDLLERFDRDVLSFNPQWVSICIGINDVWRQFDSPAITEGHVYIDEYRDNVEKMILKVKDNVKGVFILSPYIMEPNRDDTMRKKMDEYVDACKNLAEKYGCVFVDFQKMYEDYFKIQHSSFVAWDRIHPNQIGAMLMAKEFLKYCDFEF